MKIKTIIKSAVIVAMAVTMGACSKKTSVQKETGAKEITLPLEGKEYRTDKDNFRARQSGKSPDLATAKKIGLQNAKSEMAGNIQTTIKKVTDQYTNQRTVGNKQEFENKFEELAREVTNQKLADVRIAGEKVLKEQDGSYTYWIVVEANKKGLLEGIDNGISKNAKLQLDYDKKKFEDAFNAEMQKLENEQR